MQPFDHVGIQTLRESKYNYQTRLLSLPGAYGQLIQTTVRLLWEMDPNAGDASWSMGAI